MDRLAKLVAAACVLVGGVAHAGYAQLSPPPGWNFGGGAAATYAIPKSVVTETSVLLGRISANAALAVNGRTITIPAKLPLAEGAAKVAAAAIFLNPTLRTIGAVATWLGAAGLVYDVADGLWKTLSGAELESSDGYEYGYDNGTVIQWSSSQNGACQFAWPNSPEIISRYWEAPYCWADTSTKDGVSIKRYKTTLRTRGSSCPAGWYVTPAGCVQTPPMREVTKPEFEHMLPDARPMPPELPGIVWPAAWPVKAPEIQPTFVPTGSPVKNPNYDPSKPQTADNQPYIQPGVKVTPAPTATNPWQVDIQPVNRPVDSPVAKPDPVPDIDENGNPKTDQGDKPREDKEQQDLCEKHPDILACQKLDKPDEQELQQKEKPISITPDSGWGAEDAACPAPRILYVQGRQIPIPFDLFCTYMRGIRPIVIAMAWLSAAFILVGAREASA